MSKRRRSTAVGKVQASALNSKFIKPRPASRTEGDELNVEAVLQQPVTSKKPKTKKGNLSLFNILQSFVLGKLEGLDDEDLRHYILNDDAARERWGSTWHNEALLFTHTKNRQRMVEYLEKIPPQPSGHSRMMTKEEAHTGRFMQAISSLHQYQPAQQCARWDTMHKLLQEASAARKVGSRSARRQSPIRKSG